MAKFLNEDEQASPEDVEFIAQYFPNPIPENLVTRNFHKCTLKYGIVYRGSNFRPMEKERDQVKN